MLTVIIIILINKDVLSLVKMISSSRSETAITSHQCNKYYFLTHIQVSQETCKVVWYSHLFKNFPPLVVIHTVKSFSVVNDAEIDVFLEFLCFFYDLTHVDSLVSASSAFSKPSLYIWKFLVHVLLKLSLKEFDHYLLACEISAIVW